VSDCGSGKKVCGEKGYGSDQRRCGSAAFENEASIFLGETGLLTTDMDKKNLHGGGDVSTQTSVKKGTS
jgi:hypothetical protein